MKLLILNTGVVVWYLVLVTMTTVNAFKPKDDEYDPEKTCSRPGLKIPSAPPEIIPKIPFTPSVLDKEPNYGVLKQLEGTWVNMNNTYGIFTVSMPSPGTTPETIPGIFHFLCEEYTEELTFELVDGGVRNRAGTNEQIVGAVKYEQSIKNRKDNKQIHEEVGMYMYLGNVYFHPASAESIKEDVGFLRLKPGDAGQPFVPNHKIARSGTIPHGNSILLLGDGNPDQRGPPTWKSGNALWREKDHLSITASMGGGIGFPPLNLDKPAPCWAFDESLPERNFDGNPTYTQRIVAHPLYPYSVRPDLLLRDTIKGQNITNYTLIELHTEFDEGKGPQGGVLRTPLIETHTHTKDITFRMWIEEVIDENGDVVLQLQYEQIMYFVFMFGTGGGSTFWPHIQVNTLRKKKDTPEPSFEPSEDPSSTPSSSPSLSASSTKKPSYEPLLSEPSEVPSEEPSSLAPSCNDDCCNDDPEFTFDYNNETVDCKWLQSLPASRRDKLCRTMRKNLSSCALTCGLCEMNGWTFPQVEQILQDAIAVELFTIPLYLNAATSVNETERVIPLTLPDGTQHTFNPQELLLSVAVQEMFHLQLACNIANAMGVKPNIVAPDISKPPSILNITSTTLGNLTDILPAMLAIEKSDDKYPYNLNSTYPYDPDGPTLFQEEYRSIGDMYHAIAYMLYKAGWFNKLHESKYNKLQKTIFSDRYATLDENVTSPYAALNAIALIVEQGEGNGLEGFLPGGYIPNASVMYELEDQISHFNRFEAIHKYMQQNNTLKQYSGTIGGAPKENMKLSKTFQEFVKSMQNFFTNETAVFNVTLMHSTYDEALNVWKKQGIPKW